MFASWDAEEFGLLGSTEWAEVRSYTATINTSLHTTGPLFSHPDRTMPRCCRRELWPTSTQTLPSRVSVCSNTKITRSFWRCLKANLCIPGMYTLRVDCTPSLHTLVYDLTKQVDKKVSQNRLNSSRPLHLSSFYDMNACRYAVQRRERRVSLCTTAGTRGTTGRVCAMPRGRKPRACAEVWCAKGQELPEQMSESDSVPLFCALQDQ